VEVASPSAGFPELQFLVGVLHLDDRAVDEHADGDGDAGERHDVRVDAHRVHGQERIGADSAGTNPRLGGTGNDCERSLTDLRE